MRPHSTPGKLFTGGNGVLKSVRPFKGVDKGADIGIISDVVQAILVETGKRKADFIPGEVLVGVFRPQPVDTKMDETIFAKDGVSDCLRGGRRMGEARSGVFTSQTSLAIIG